MTWFLDLLDIALPELNSLLANSSFFKLISPIYEMKVVEFQDFVCERKYFQCLRSQWGPFLFWLFSVIVFYCSERSRLEGHVSPGSVVRRVCGSCCCSLSSPFPAAEHSALNLDRVISPQFLTVFIFFLYYV